LGKLGWLFVSVTAILALGTAEVLFPEAQAPPAEHAVHGSQTIELEPPLQASDTQLSAWCSSRPLSAFQTSASRKTSEASVEESLDKAQKDIGADRFDEALSICQKVLTLDPKSARAYYLVGIIQVQLGATDVAKKAFIESVKIDPARIGTHIYLGKLYLLSKDWDTAKPEFQEALKLGDETGSAEYGLALAELGKSRISEALPHLLAAVEADPKDQERLFTLIGTELRLKQTDSARKHLTELEELYPHDAYLFFRLGKLLKEQHMPLEAEARFNRAVGLLGEPQVDPAPPEVKPTDVYLELARLRYDHHDYPGTFQYLDKVDAGTVEPNVQAELLHLRGAALLSVGKFQDAQDDLRQATELNPGVPDYYVHWAWAELLAGKFDAAKCAATFAKNKWPGLPNIEMLEAILERERMPERARIPFKTDWHLKGEGLVCCPCTTPCPCRSNAPPTEGHCENTGVMRITEGRYGNISLNGLTFAAIHGSMGEASAPSSVYVNSSASDEQLIALERIFQTFNPLRPFLFPSVKRTNLQLVHSLEDKTYEVAIPQVLEIKIQRQLDGASHPLLQTAAIDYFSNTLEYARNLTYKVYDADGGLRWDYSNRQANYRTIDLDSRDYWEGKMLIQYVDGSGFFNEEQLELIKGQKLPTLQKYPSPAK
jgi:Flp pilus assembly protein TadD